ncbi:MAG: DNA-binding protein [Candidatus Omnitrophica bacterium]|nr:DNA-binding protein [Candidatus Omnitrophota bacterium]
MKINNVKRLIFAILLACFINVAPGLAFGHISSTELIDNAKEYDGKKVVYRGEVIGEVMKRGDFAWVNIHDGEHAIGIWAPFSLTKSIVYTGSYKAKGDVFEITGVFNRACPDHGGDLDIHAQVFKKIESGRLISQEVNPDKIKKASILLGVLLLVWILRLFFRK